jgi:large subunit ribosomal protein L13
MSTYFPKPGEIAPNWHVSTPPAKCWAGLPPRFPSSCRASTSRPTRPTFDTGDFVIVLNADKVKVTGRKADVIEYDTYSRYPRRAPSLFV